MADKSNIPTTLKEYNMSRDDLLSNGIYFDMNEEKKREKLSMFFDDVTAPWLQSQGADLSDPEAFSEVKSGFINKYIIPDKPKKKDGVTGPSRESLGVEALKAEVPEQFVAQEFMDSIFNLEYYNESYGEADPNFVADHYDELKKAKPNDPSIEFKASISRQERINTVKQAEKRAMNDGKDLYSLGPEEAQRYLVQAQGYDIGALETATSLYNRAFFSILAQVPKAVGIMDQAIQSNIVGLTAGKEAKKAYNMINPIEQNPAYALGDYVQNRVINNLFEINPALSDMYFMKNMSGAGSIVPYVFAGWATGGAKAAATLSGNIPKATSLVGKLGLNTPQFAVVASMGALQNGVPEYDAAYKQISEINNNTREEYMAGDPNDAAARGKNWEKFQGKDPTDVAYATFLANAAVGTLEAVPITIGLGKIGKLMGRGFKRDLMKAMVGSGLEEALQESVNSVASNFTARQLYDNQRKIYEGLKDDASIGFILGALTMGFGGAISNGFKKATTAEERSLLTAAEEYRQQIIATLPEKSEWVFDPVNTQSTTEIQGEIDNLTLYMEDNKENLLPEGKSAIVDKLADLHYLRDQLANDSYTETAQGKGDRHALLVLGEERGKREKMLETVPEDVKEQVLEELKEIDLDIDAINLRQQKFEYHAREQRRKSPERKVLQSDSQGNLRPVSRTGLDQRGNRKAVDPVTVKTADVERIVDDNGESRLIELKKTPTAAASFRTAIDDGRKTTIFGPAVDVHDQSKYEEATLYMADDGSGGVALTPEGDLISAFRNHEMSTDINAVNDLVWEILKDNKATTANAYDINGVLPNKWKDHGFVPVARVKWNDEFAPEGWDYDELGRPDVVLFAHNGKSWQENRDTQFPPYNPEVIPLFEDMEHAETAQRATVGNPEQIKKAQENQGKEMALEKAQEEQAAVPETQENVPETTRTVPFTEDNGFTIDPLLPASRHIIDEKTTLSDIINNKTVKPLLNAWMLAADKISTKGGKAKAAKALKELRGAVEGLGFSKDGARNIVTAMKQFPGDIKPEVVQTAAAIPMGQTAITMSESMDVDEVSAEEKLNDIVSEEKYLDPAVEKQIREVEDALVFAAEEGVAKFDKLKEKFDKAPTGKKAAIAQEMQGQMEENQKLLAAAKEQRITGGDVPARLNKAGERAVLDRLDSGELSFAEVIVGLEASGHEITPRIAEEIELAAEQFADQYIRQAALKAKPMEDFGIPEAKVKTALGQMASRNTTEGGTAPMRAYKEAIKDAFKSGEIKVVAEDGTVENVPVSVYEDLLFGTEKELDENVPDPKGDFLGELIERRGDETQAAFDRRRAEAKRKFKDGAQGMLEALNVTSNLMAEDRPDFMASFHTMAEAAWEMQAVNFAEFVENIKKAFRKSGVYNKDQLKMVDEFVDANHEAANLVWEAKTKPRALSEYLLQKGNLDPEVQQEMKNARYVPVSNTITKKEADTIIAGKGTEQALIDAANLRNAIHPRVRVAIGAAVMREYGRQKQKARAAGNETLAKELTLKRANVADMFSEIGTYFGQGVQAFVLWHELSPEGLILKLEREADRAGVDPLTEAERVELEALTEIWDAAPEGFQKHRALMETLNFEYVRAGNYQGDVAMSIWYANILSGYKTQWLNIMANLAETMMEFGVSAITNPKKAKYIAAGLYRGLGTGVYGTWSTLQTGYSPIKSSKIESVSGDVMVSPLEAIDKTRGKWSPLRLHKFVQRFMSGADTFFYSGLKEMRAHEMAWYANREQGLRGKRLAVSVSQQMGTRPQQIKAAEKQAESEAKEFGLSKTDQKLREREILEQQRGAQILAESHDFGARGTFNYQPEGLLGRPAHFLSRFTSEVDFFGTRPLKFFIPFTRVIANVANRYLDYTPYGFVRAGVVDWALQRPLKPGQETRGTTSYSMRGQEKWSHNLSKQEHSKQLTKAILGSSAMMALGAMVFLGDEEEDDGWFGLTGSGTGDFKKNYQLEDSGLWQEHSIYFGKKGGRRQFISYKNTPFMLPFAMVGNASDQAKYNDKEMGDDKFSTQMGNAALATLSAWTDMTFLTGLNELLSVFGENKDIGNGISRVFAKSATSFVMPNMALQLVRLGQHFTDKPIGNANTVLERELRKLPTTINPVASAKAGKVEKYQDMVNVLNEPVVPDINQYFALREQNDVWALITEKKMYIGNAPKTMLIREELMTTSQYDAFNRFRGQFIMDAIKKNMALVRRMPDENAQKWRDNVQSAANQYARNKVIAKKIK